MADFYAAKSDIHILFLLTGLSVVRISMFRKAYALLALFDVLQVLIMRVMRRDL